MKLLVPFLDEPARSDVRLVQLAEHLGVESEWLRLTAGISDPAAFMEASCPDKRAAIVINPSVIGRWLLTEIFPSALASYLVSRFPFIFVHPLNPDPISGSAVCVLSEDRLQGVIVPVRPEQGYQVLPGTEDVCARFAGLAFGPADPAQDRVLQMKAGDQRPRPLILIDRQPCFVQWKRESSEIFFLAASETGALDADVAEIPLAGYFSRLLPQAMVLRRAFGAASWRPQPPLATLIIDDPPLWKNYGFLNYERLLALMDQNHFHTSIAFIPYYFRKSAPSVVRLFKERSDRLSICFHGNDHTSAELGTDEPSALNAILTNARARMEVLRRKTGIVCDNVMVFPQGIFSENTMAVLKAHNFRAAVNSGHSPYQKRAPLTPADLLQPAILKYRDFPLFLRKYVGRLKPEDVAFNAFFGRPVLLVEHHDVFRNPGPLIEAVKMVHRIVPDVRWTNLQTVVENAYLTRCAPDETQQVRAFANAAMIRNDADGPSARPNIRRTMKAFARRKLSEFRDNHLIRHPALLSMAKSLLGRFTKN